MKFGEAYKLYQAMEMSGSFAKMARAGCPGALLGDVRGNAARDMSARTGTMAAVVCEWLLVGGGSVVGVVRVYVA